MDKKNNPTNIRITKSDFNNEVCEKILNESPGIDYHSMHGAFLNSALSAREEGNLKHEKMYRLLSDACSMCLSPESRNEPFKPLVVFTDRRSPMVDDFSVVDINFFSEILDKITNIRLKARLADILWLRKFGKGVNYALNAIDSYRKIPLNEEEWIPDGGDCWERAIRLAIMLGLGAGNRIQEMEEEILQAFTLSTESDIRLIWGLADLMAKFGFCKSNAVIIAEKLEKLAVSLEQEGSVNCKENYSTCNEKLHSANDYFERAEQWYKIANNRSKMYKMTVFRADLFEKLAKFGTEAGKPHSLSAQDFYERAIQILRTIPNEERPFLKIDERISELQKLMGEAGKSSINQMGTISTGSIDITKIVETAQSAVTNKSTIDALKAFVNLSSGINLTEMQDNVIKELQHPTLRSLIPVQIRNRDGRKVTKLDSINTKDKLDRNSPRVLFGVMQKYNHRVIIFTQGAILPALGVLQLEHRLREADFLCIVKRSAIVPIGREVLFAKGLYSVYDFDFITALHLLTPQIENLVRYHLNEAGAQTKRMDEQGIESENSLASLIKDPKMKEIFGEELTFEIQALFCDPLGANIRNKIAHGMFDDKDFTAYSCIYTWWFCLKLVLKNFWNSARKTPEAENTKTT